MSYSITDNTKNITVFVDDGLLIVNRQCIIIAQYVYISPTRDKEIILEPKMLNKWRIFFVWKFYPVKQSHSHHMLAHTSILRVEWRAEPSNVENNVLCMIKYIHLLYLLIHNELNLCRYSPYITHYAIHTYHNNLFAFFSSYFVLTWIVDLREKRERECN